MRRCSGAEAGISAELSTFGPLKPLKFHMPRTITLTLSPKQAADRKVYTEIAARRAGGAACRCGVGTYPEAFGGCPRAFGTGESDARTLCRRRRARSGGPLRLSGRVACRGGRHRGRRPCRPLLCAAAHRIGIPARHPRTGPGGVGTPPRRGRTEPQRPARPPTPTMPSAKEVRVPFPTASSLPGARSAEITTRRSVRSSSTVPTRRYSMKPIRISVPTGCPVS